MVAAIDNVLDKIGPTFKQAIYEDLERAGISLVHPCSSLEDIDSALREYFGHDGAKLLTKAIEKRMKSG